MAAATAASVGAEVLEERTSHVYGRAGAVGAEGSVGIGADNRIGKRGTAFDPVGSNDEKSRDEQSEQSHCAHMKTPRAKKMRYSPTSASEFTTIHLE
jgi:hypothetical protein